MELASRIRWILVLLVGILFLFLVVWGLLSIASDLFRGSETSPATLSQSDDTVVISTATAKLIVDGRVVASSEHRSYTIEVSQNVVTMKVFSDYGQKLITEKSYKNNREAYDSFIHSLDVLDVTARQRGTTQADDTNELGVCPSGSRYIIELDNSIRRWGTNCNRRDGTAGFEITGVVNLFNLQVPDYIDLVRGTGL